MMTTPRQVREFETGATRDQSDDKFDYEGFLSPLVIEAFGAYMHEHRHQVDGTLRASDNWQKGIPKSEYIKSAWRHFVDLWKEHRGIPSREGIVKACCGILFNVMGYLHEHLRSTRRPEVQPAAKVVVCGRGPDCPLCRVSWANQGGL